MARSVILLTEVAHHLSTLNVACNRCERRGRLSVARLAKEHGEHIDIPDLLRAISHDCPRRNADRITELCGAHFPDLSRIYTARHD